MNDGEPVQSTLHGIGFTYDLLAVFSLFKTLLKAMSNVEYRMYNYLNEIISISVFFVCTTIEPRFTDTHLIRTPVNNGQFRLFRH